MKRRILKKVSKKVAVILQLHHLHHMRHAIGYCYDQTPSSVYKDGWLYRRIETLYNKDMLALPRYKITSSGLAVTPETRKLNAKVLIESLRFELAIRSNPSLFFPKLVDAYCKEFAKYEICQETAVCDFEGFAQMLCLVRDIDDSEECGEDLAIESLSEWSN